MSIFYFGSTDIIQEDSMSNKKITFHSELVYAAAIILLALAVAMLSAADFGVSMIVAPAYIISQKLGVITFGQGEYVVQSILFIVFCILMRKVKLVYFSSFATCLIYGAVLDIWRKFVPLFNPDIVAPGSMTLPIRILLFLGGMILTSFSVMLFYKTYLYPQVYDFFVKGVSSRFNKDRTKTKIAFDFSCLAVSCVLTLVLFRKFVGIGVGTLVLTALNGFIIGWFDKMFDKCVNLKPFFPKFAEKFDL